MRRVHGLRLVLALGVVAALIALIVGRIPVLAAGQDSELALLKERIGRVEDKVTRLAEQLKQLVAVVEEHNARLTKLQEGESKTLDERISVLEKKTRSLMGHSHDYTQQGQAADGSLHTVRPDQFMGSGLTGTGVMRIGKPIMGQ